MKSIFVVPQAMRVLSLVLYLFSLSIAYSQENYDDVLLPKASESEIVRTESGSISGRVASMYGDGLAGASAYFLETRERIALDGDGMYNVDDLSAGTYHVAIVHPGYNVYLTKIEVKAAKQIKTVLVMTPESYSASSRYDALTTELQKMMMQCGLKKHIVENADEQKNNGATSQNEATKTSNTSSASPSITNIIIAEKNVEPTPVQKQGADADVAHDENHSPGIIASMSINPNPTEEQATLNFELRDNGKVMLEIFQVESGRRVTLSDLGSLSKGAHTSMLNISNFSSGTYTAVLRQSTCQYAVTTFVKK